MCWDSVQFKVRAEQNSTPVLWSLNWFILFRNSRTETMETRDIWPGWLADLVWSCVIINHPKKHLSQQISVFNRLLAPEPGPDVVIRHVILSECQLPATDTALSEFSTWNNWEKLEIEIFNKETGSLIGNSVSWSSSDWPISYLLALLSHVQTKLMSARCQR